ncbi:MAG: hypothetical protein IPG56_09275 [Caulobacteraceae bacterium]|nr:hypothetical protein [Caulobacteraceae bacterium]
MRCACGIGVQAEHHRDYPQGALGAHVIGFTGIEATSGELFDLSQPLEVDNTIIQDHEPISGYATLRDILARSSNVGAARLALRLGGARQRSYFERLGLTSPTTLQLGRRQAPLAPAAQGRRDVAGLGLATASRPPRCRWRAPTPCSQTTARA